MWTLTLGREQIDSQSGHPSLGILHRGDKPPFLLGNLLRPTEDLEKPRLFARSAHVLAC